MKEEKWEPHSTFLVPKDYQPPTFYNDSFKRKPDHIYDYRLKDNSTFCYIGRFELSQGKKVFLPHTYGSLNNVLGWYWKKPKGKAPLYNLRELLSRIKAFVIVVEGEKAAEAAKKLFPGYVIVTSMGGAKAAHKTDWSPLKGRKVFFLRDFDESGLDYQNEIIEILHKLGNEDLHIVEYPSNTPKKWDPADPLPSGWTRKTLYELIRDAEHVPIVPPKKDEKEPSIPVQIIQAAEATPNFSLFPNQYEEASVRFMENQNCSSVRLVSSTRFKRFISKK